jgi:hypothetical protein
MTTSSAARRSIEAGDRQKPPYTVRRLRDIVEVKLTEQRDYVVWRDEEMKPRCNQGTDGRYSRAAAVVLPPFHPGQDIADRWRKALVKKDFYAALNDAQHRSLRVCEQENANTIRGTEGTGEFERYTPAAYVEAARVLYVLKHGDWRKFGDGFDDVNVFVRSLQLDQFKIVADQRKAFAEQVKKLQPEVSNRAIARRAGCQPPDGQQ